jgi:hypothetical protein
MEVSVWCRECKKRDTCKALCEGAERFVSQDHVSQRERTLSGLAREVNERGDETDGNIDLDNLVFKVKYPHTWEDLASGPSPACVSCGNTLLGPVAVNQKYCPKCKKESTLMGWRKAQAKSRNKNKGRT